MSIAEIIKLSELLGQMADIKRATKLPNGEFEPDSHHSFSLALVAFQVCHSEDLDLDVNKVVLYALVHDLLELITGDEDTLNATSEQLDNKRRRETDAVGVFEELLSAYPEIKHALHDYERLDTPEAATVFVLDKACTTWTHHVDLAEYALQRGLTSRQDITNWENRKREVIDNRLVANPPRRIIEIYEESFEALRGLYDA